VDAILTTAAKACNMMGSLAGPLAPVPIRTPTITTTTTLLAFPQPSSLPAHTPSPSVHTANPTNYTRNVHPKKLERILFRA